MEIKKIETKSKRKNYFREIRAKKSATKWITPKRATTKRVAHKVVYPLFLTSYAVTLLLFMQYCDVFISL